MVQIIDINDCCSDLDDNYVDSNGKPPKFLNGELAWFKPLQSYVIVDHQIKHYDCDETFFGNCFIWFDGNIKGECNGWQLQKLYETD